MNLPPSPRAERPGVWRRAAAGAFHAPAGFAFLLRTPALWPLAALPAALTVGLSTAGLVLSWYQVPRVEAALAPARERVGDLLALLATVVLGIVTLAAGTLLGLGLALLLASPLLDLLSQKAERLAGSPPPGADRGLRFEIVESLRGALFFTAAVPLAFLVGLVPLVGPPVAASWSAYALAFQLTDGPLARRGLGFSAKVGWHREWRPEAMGFGLAALLMLLVPFAVVLVAPALTVGAARLVGELSGPPSARPSPPGPKRPLEPVRT